LLSTIRISGVMIAIVVMVVSTAAAVIAWRRGPEYLGWRRWVANGGIAAATAAVALFWIGVAPGFFGHPMFRSRRAFADLAALGFLCSVIAMPCGWLGKRYERYAYISGLLSSFVWAIAFLGVSLV